MLNDDFYKNVLSVISEDSGKLKDFFVNGILNADTLDQKSQGKAALAHYFSTYLNAIQTWCEQNETSSSFTPTTFLPESNPSIMYIINPDAVNLKNTDEQEDA